MYTNGSSNSLKSLRKKRADREVGGLQAGPWSVSRLLMASRLRLRTTVGYMMMSLLVR